MFRKKHSVTAYFLTVLILWTLSSVTVIAIISFITIRRLQERTSSEKQVILQYTQKQTDQLLRDSYVALSDMLSTSELILNLQMSSDASSISLSKSQLYRQMTSLSSSHTNIDGFFFYYPSETGEVDDFFILTQNGSQALAETLYRSSMYSIIRNGLINADLLPDKWSILNIGQQYYLFCVLEERKCFAGYYVNLDTLLITPEELGNPNSLASFSDSEGTILCSSNPKLQNGSALPHLNDSETLVSRLTIGSFIQISVQSSLTPLHLVALIPSSDILESYSGLRPMLIASGILILLLFIALMYLINRLVILPLRGLYHTTEEIRTGNIEARATPDTHVLELDTLGQSLNDMMDEAKTLRIRIYEQELQERQTKLDYLQIQVEPHFFLNCLNLIYSLAELDKLDTVKKLSLNLSRYFRFRFQNPANFIPVKNELEHVKNYMDIQQIRFGDSLSCSIFVDPELADTLLPPLSIQTFVENSIKYGMVPKQKNLIEIKVEKKYDLMMVTVRDNGKGYSADVLQVLNSSNRFPGDETRRIGITNVKERLVMLYGENAFFNFYNNNGSVAEFIIPITNQEESEHV